MGLGVGQVEAAAQRMAELVVQRHADRAQRHAGEPGAIERRRAGRQVVAARD